MRHVVAVAQLRSGTDKAANFEAVAGLAAEAKARGAALLCLPENVGFMGDADGAAREAAEPLTGPSMARYAELAARHSLWLSVGGFQVSASSLRVTFDLV